MMATKIKITCNNDSNNGRKVAIEKIFQSFKAYEQNDLNEENKTFKSEKRHVSATPVPSSVYRWNYNDEQYIAEKLE